jgi:hypothetical protein
MGLLFYQEPDPPRPPRRKRRALSAHLDEDEREDVQVDPEIINAFACLQWAWDHKSGRAERRAWEQLMQTVLKLPPPRD